MDILIVTGMSGAGKSKCLKILEDLGYLCIDNMLPRLIPEVVAECDRNKEAAHLTRLALGADVRGGVFFDGIYDALDVLKSKGYRPRVIFLDAQDVVLVNRYKETRREHPLSVGGRVAAGLTKEREVLEPLRLKSDIYIDTSHLTPADLKQKVYHILPERGVIPPAVILISFGYKRGIPMDSDMVYDMRFLPNPFHEPELRPFNGTNREVSEYVYADPAAKSFVESISTQILAILPAYLVNVKSNLVIGIGCTGGKHRSVATTEHLASLLRADGVKVEIEHRDLFKE